MWNFATQYPYLFTLNAIVFIFFASKTIANSVQWLFIATIVAKMLGQGWTYEQIKDQINMIAKENS